MSLTLFDMEYGTHGVIKEIKKYSRELNALGIRVGKLVKMVTKQPIKGPVVVITGEVQVAIGIEMASGIIVDKYTGPVYQDDK